MSEEQGLRGPCILIEGSVVIGLKFIGPFATVADAVTWHEERGLPAPLSESAIVALLVTP